MQSITEFSWRADNLLTVLKTARSFIAAPEQWCQRSYAIVKGRVDTELSLRQIADRYAIGQCQFCAVGAIYQAVSRLFDTYGELKTVIEKVLIVEKLLSPKVIAESMNDDPRTTHTMVIARYDRAISWLETLAPDSFVDIPAIPFPRVD